MINVGQEISPIAPGSDVMADVASQPGEAWATVSQPAGYGLRPLGVGGRWPPNLNNQPWSLTAKPQKPLLARERSSSPTLADYCWSDLWRLWLPDKTGSSHGNFSENTSCTVLSIEKIPKYLKVFSDESRIFIIGFFMSANIHRNFWKKEGKWKPQLDPRKTAGAAALSQAKASHASNV